MSPGEEAVEYVIQHSECRIIFVSTVNWAELGKTLLSLKEQVHTLVYWGPQDATVDTKVDTPLTAAPMPPLADMHADESAHCADRLPHRWASRCTAGRSFWRSARRIQRPQCRPAQMTSAPSCTPPEQPEHQRCCRHPALVAALLNLGRVTLLCRSMHTARTPLLRAVAGIVHFRRPTA